MATGIQAQRVTTTVVVKGQDKASAQIRKATGSLGKFERQAGKARAKMNELGSAARSALSGDVLGAVGSFRSALGGIGGPAGTAALATAGVAALGVATVAAAVKMTRMLEEIERFRVQARAAFAGGEQEALRFADQIGGVTVRSVVEFRSQLAAAGIDAKLTAEQLQNLTAIAANVGKTGDDALTALAQAIRTGNTRALNSVGVFINASRVQDDYAKALGKTTTQLTAQEKQQAVVAALQEKLAGKVEATNTVWARQDAALAKLDNAFERVKLQISDGLAPATVSVTEATSTFLDLLVDLERDYDRAYNRSTDLARGLSIVDQKLEAGVITIDEYGDAMFRARQGAQGFSDALMSAQRASEAATRSMVKQLGAMGRLRTVEGFMGTIEGRGATPPPRRKRRRTGRTSATQAQPKDEALERANKAVRDGAQLQRQLEAMLKAQNDALKVDEDLAVVRAQINGLTGEALQRLKVEIDLKRKIREIESQGGPDEEKKKELARLQAQLQLQQIEQDARKAATDARLEQERQLAEAQQRAIELERMRRMEAIDTAGSIVGAAAALAQATGLMDKNDRLQRAILAARSLADASRETALAATAAATGNAPKAVAHGLAAAAHVAAAASYRSKSGGGGKAGGGRAASVGAVDAVARGGQRERAGNVTINLPPGAYIGTPAQLGAELRRLQLATAGTGV